MTDRLNYSSQACEMMKILNYREVTISPIGKKQQTSNPLAIAATARETIILLNKAEKFILPEWGRIFTDDEWEMVMDVRYPTRLPYPVIACEYPAPYHGDYSGVIENVEAPSSKSIALAAEYEALISLCPDIFGPMAEQFPGDPRGFYIFPVCYADGAEVWTPPPCTMFMPRGGHQELMRNELGHVAILPLGSEAYDHYPESERSDRAARDVADEALAICQLMTALALDKGRHETLPAPEKLNRKRAKKGRVPLFEYKVLDIVADVLHQPKESSHAQHRSVGHHASPRMHTRRGHVRKLASGKATWVRNAIIGKPGRGQILKQYAVHD